MLKIFQAGAGGFEAALADLERRGDMDLDRVEPAVREILVAVRSRGDAALRELTQRFESRDTAIAVPDDWREAGAQLDPRVRDALTEAARRVRAFHEHQRDTGFRFQEAGVELGQRIRPVRSAGVYAPGGKARYPSTVLMAAIPAAVAGVPRIVLATPRPTPDVLAAASLAGVTEVYDVGGAQAIGALAYGTETVGRVDTIVGPGNIYVACAKRLVFGTVNIDQIAGPSEILVVADDTANPQIVAADLLSQAEHDEDAYALLVTTSRSLADAVCTHLAEQVTTLSRQSIARASLERHGQCFVVDSMDQAARVADRLAPEHLALEVSDPESVLEGITAVGAAFLGHHTPEAAGDYAAGPSHVLPTGGAARFGSPLGVYDFVVRTSIIRYDADAIDRQADLLETLAELEGLTAHARSVSLRRKPPAP
ncbi:MAG: histidinol dehydrogenase [Myxococcales bacterium]|nr:histidinol dehydrogenase [Myxococcales bacterium]